MIPLKDANALSRFPFWVILIILLNIYVFYRELSVADAEAFILQFALIPAQIDPAHFKTLLPLLTSQFLHGGFLHIASNMLFLWVFGNNVEVSLGFFLFPVFYLAAGVVAGLAQYLAVPSADVPMLGASGAVAGVLGAYFALFPNSRIRTLIFIFFFVTIVDIPAFFLLFYWFITQFFSGLASFPINPTEGGVAFISHIGGFLFGWFTAIPLLARKQHLHYRFFS